MKPTKEEYVKHLKEGLGDNCLVCDQTLYGEWTDYNGEIKCLNCGMTYQILGSHLKEEFLQENGLKKEDIARKYCPAFQLIPMLREFWQEKHSRIPFGCFLGSTNQITQEEYEIFDKWLKDNKSRLQEEYKNDFYWDQI